MAVSIDREISASEFEREIRGGRALTILDVRRADDFDAWHIDPGAATLISLPLEALQRDGLDPAEGDVRVICSRGNSSLTAVAELARRGIESLSVSGGMLAWGRLLTAERVDIGTGTGVTQFRREARGCLSYLIDRDGAALVVDPAPDPGAYLEHAQRLGATITAVLDTHVHADHLSGARRLAAATGADLHLSPAALARGLTFPEAVSPVDDGDPIELGAANVRVVGLPGHTGDNIGVLIDGRALVAGDSLFVDAVARPDLEAGDAGAGDAARTLHRTLRTAVLSLPDETVLLPCHYPGGRTGGPVVSTIGRARDRIAVLALAEDAFVRAVLTEMPPRPANYEQIIAANLGVDAPADAALLEVGANNCAAGPGTVAEGSA
ncbi:MAG TPA: MBL fold metallo-hydrolase [Gaiellales bacterium]|nr:MBL fold metallo-hydrolase [Gaiellales bacterium]